MEPNTVTYRVGRGQDGWQLSDGDWLVLRGTSHATAMEVAHILTAGVKAAGGSALIVVEADDGREGPFNTRFL